MVVVMNYLAPHHLATGKQDPILPHFCDYVEKAGNTEELMCSTCFSVKYQDDASVMVLHQNIIHINYSIAGQHET